jgi:hypothetical protein
MALAWHLAWYLALLRNCLGYAEDPDASFDIREVGPNAFQLVAPSPVVLPAVTIVTCFAAIHACKLP